MEILTKISAFFDGSIPFGVVAIIVYLALMSRDIKQIQKDLRNHITETNKKIEHLTNRFDKISDRFDRLYEILLKEKQNKSSK